MGQMEWFDLIDEIITTALTVPLYSILKDGRTKPGQNLRVITVAFGIHVTFAVTIALHIGRITEFMQAENAVGYLVL